MHILLIHQAFVTGGDAGGTRHYEFARHLIRHGHRVSVITSDISYLTGIRKKDAHKKDARKEDTHKEDTHKEDARKEAVERAAGNPTEDSNLRIYYSFTSSGLHKGFLPRLFSFFSFMISAFFTALSIPDVDVVWGTSPNLFQALTAWLSARCKRSRFLLEIRDLWPDFAIELGVLKNPFLIACSRGLETFLYRHADRIIVNSPGFIPHIQKKSGQTPTLIPNAADIAMFTATEADRKDFRHQHGLEHAFVVMYCGAHGPANDLNVVLDAAELLREDTNIRFVFVGSGKDKVRLVESAKKRNLDNVIFIPPVSKTDMPRVMAAADAGLAILKPIPLFKTTYPNKVFDTMAAGKPVLCQIDGVIREVIEKYDAGLFIEPGNPIALASVVREVAAAPARCREMGVNGQAAIRTHFSREQTANQIEQVLLEMTASQAVSGRPHH